MAQGRDGEETSTPDDFQVMDFRVADFPSDALSVKRLRAVFPERFGRCDGALRDGYPECDFFAPGTDRIVSEHQLRLTELLGNERVVAAGSYFRRFLAQIPDVLDEEEWEVVALAERQLEEGYQYFKLADSPETARFLIEQVKAEGVAQAQARQSRTK